MMSVHSGLWAYGGAEPQEATHYCFQCQAFWISPGWEPETIPCPTDCHFCGKRLREAELLRFHTQYEGWAENHIVKFSLEEPIFSDVPFPTCTECREGILENHSDLEEERLREESDRPLMLGLFVLLIGCFVIATALILFLRF